MCVWCVHVVVGAVCIPFVFPLSVHALKLIQCVVIKKGYMFACVVFFIIFVS